jgi:hypothetical protein
MALLTEDADPAPRGPGRAFLAAGAALVLLAAFGVCRCRRAPATPSPAAPSPSRPVARAVGRGALEIAASPLGATVTLDGQVLGPAPQSLPDLPAGPHRVRVELAGHETWEQDAHVIPGLTTRLQARLSREPGRVRVESDVAGADVFVDRKFVGKAPMELPELAPGPHQINVSAEGYEGYAETIDVSPGRHTVSVRFKEIRLAEELDVVHRHALGSCSGRLSASVAGIRYETENAKDTFEAPLSAIERLEVDYLKKSLTLRLQRRTYNFAPRDGDADRLIVFREHVEKARLRLTAPPGR